MFIFWFFANTRDLEIERKTYHEGDNGMFFFKSALFFLVFVKQWKCLHASSIVCKTTQGRGIAFFVDALEVVFFTEKRYIQELQIFFRTFN